MINAHRAPVKRQVDGFPGQILPVPVNLTRHTKGSVPLGPHFPYGTDASLVSFVPLIL